MAEVPSESSPIKTTPSRWNALRLKIAAGDHADTSLEKLSQAAGLEGWPLRGADETPSKYIELSLDELLTMPGFDKQPKLVDRLCLVLMSADEDDVAAPAPALRLAKPEAAATPAPAPKPKPGPGCKTSAADWDKIRKSFSKSMMVDLKLGSLAENLELPAWPLSGDEETPAKYIDFTLDELGVMTEFHGKPARIDHLYRILNENLSQDEEFEDMVDPINKQLDRTDVLLQVLRRFEIPENYPFTLLAFPKNVRDTVPAAQVKTLGEFVRFYQKISEKGVVLGEIKTVLQAISAGDEARLAQWMPYRPGSHGFHFIEAIALAVKSLDQDTLKSLVKKYGKKLDQADDYALKSSWQDLAAKGESKLDAATNECAPQFAADIADARTIINSGGAMELDRFLLPLGDSDLELIVAHALIRHIRGRDEGVPATSAPVSSSPSGGFFAKLKALFSRG